MKSLVTESYACDACGVPVWRTGGADNEWYWTDLDGSSVGLDHIWLELGVEPYQRLAKLSREIVSYHGLRDSQKTPEQDRVINARFIEYSLLGNRIAFGGGPSHVHRVAAEVGNTPLGGQTPEHCGFPAYRRPSGWQCRECRADLGDDAAVGWAA